MTTTEINIAIAQACGWKPILICLDFNGKPLEGQSAPPNYAESLDAITLAEATLINSEYIEFARHLCEIWLRENSMPINKVVILRSTSATAAQRTEAFLRVKGLWREGK